MAENKQSEFENVSLTIPKDNASHLDDTNNQKTGRQRQNSFHNFRFIILLLAAISNGLLVLIVSMGVAQQNMVNQTALNILDQLKRENNVELTLLEPMSNNQSITSSNVESLLADGYKSEEKVRDGPFVWSTTIQQFILNAFAFTFAAVQIFGGPTIERVGNYKVSMIGQMISGFSAVLIPTVAYWGSGWPYVAFMRAILGIGSGFVYPSIYATVEKWSPPESRAAGIAFVQFGSGVGNTLSSPLAGFLCDLTFMGGWPLVFYTNFVLVCIWTVCWYFLSAESPEKHPYISEKELKSLRASLGDTHVNQDFSQGEDLNQTTTTASESMSNETKTIVQKFSIEDPPSSPQNRQAVEQNGKAKMVWSEVLRAKPIWAAIAIYSIYCGTNTIIIMNTPNYFKNKLHFDNKKNGTSNGLMQLGITISYIVCGALEWRLKELKFAKPFIRRFIFCLGAFATGFFLCIIPFVPVERGFIIVGLFILSRLFHGFLETQLAAAVFDMAPDFSGFLMGYVNGVSAIVAFGIAFGSGPFLDSGHNSLQQWNRLYIICAGLLWTSAAIYSFYVKFESIFDNNNSEIKQVVDIKSDSFEKSLHKTQLDNSKSTSANADNKSSQQEKKSS